MDAVMSRDTDSTSNHGKFKISKFPDKRNPSNVNFNLVN